MVATTLSTLQLKHSQGDNTIWQGQIFDDLDMDPKLKTLSAKILVGNTEVWIIELLYSLEPGFLKARFKVQSINFKLQPFQVHVNKGPSKEHNGLH